MKLHRSTGHATRLILLDKARSTNDELMQRVLGDERIEAWPEFSVLVTDNQTAGRGRLGRAWVAPVGTMLAISVLLRPEKAGIRAAGATSWVPLIAGLAMTRALAALGAPTELKWPNDVLIDGRKVCGILAEAQPGDTIIVGSGVNLTVTADDLPVPTATSMLIAGAETDADAVLASYLKELRELYRRFAAAGGDADASGIRAAVTQECSTLGRTVRVQLPGDEDLIGTAKELDANGRLVVEASGRLTAVSAGDVTHLRY
ncbi:biotin--[acetyl-CoA-carboxylase] ligase [Humibacter ginsengisoli]